jgi:hypothetical protein
MSSDSPIVEEVRQRAMQISSTTCDGTASAYVAGSKSRSSARES